MAWPEILASGVAALTASAVAVDHVLQRMSARAGGRGDPCATCVQADRVRCLETRMAVIEALDKQRGAGGSHGT